MVRSGIPGVAEAPFLKRCGCLSKAAIRCAPAAGVRMTTLMIRLFALLLIASVAPLAAADLPAGETPPGKVVLVPQPHHDDHSTDYGMAGLIARLVDEGFRAIYIRASNDEKDGAHGYPRNDMINERETKEAIAVLGMEKVISLNWRNNFESAYALNDLREQLIFLIRKYKPDVILGHNGWEHYQKNAGHRNVGWMLDEAFWLAGLRNVHSEHFEMGVEPHAASYFYGKARLTWGLGHRPNIVMEFNADQQKCKEIAFQLHRNVRAKPAGARSLRRQLARMNLQISEFENLDDQEIAVLTANWSMEYISRLHGSHAGVEFGEEYYFMDEFYGLPGLQGFLEGNIETR